MFLKISPNTYTVFLSSSIVPGLIYSSSWLITTSISNHPALCPPDYFSLHSSFIWILLLIFTSSNLSSHAAYLLPPGWHGHLWSLLLLLSFTFITSPLVSLQINLFTPTPCLQRNCLKSYLNSQPFIHSPQHLYNSQSLNHTLYPPLMLSLLKTLLSSPWFLPCSRSHFQSVIILGGTPLVRLFSYSSKEWPVIASYLIQDDQRYTCQRQFRCWSQVITWTSPYK